MTSSFRVLRWVPAGSNGAGTGPQPEAWSASGRPVTSGVRRPTRRRQDRTDRTGRAGCFLPLEWRVPRPKGVALGRLGAPARTGGGSVVALLGRKDFEHLIRPV